MPPHQSSFLDFADEIQHFLRSPDGKGGDDQIAAAVKGLLNLPGKRLPHNRAARYGNGRRMYFP